MLVAFSLIAVSGELSTTALRTRETYHVPSPHTSFANARQHVGSHSTGESEHLTTLYLLQVKKSLLRRTLKYNFWGAGGSDKDGKKELQGSSLSPFSSFHLDVAKRQESAKKKPCLVYSRG